MVCIGCGLSLWATGVLTLPQSLAGFGDPATVFVASLFVASAALEKTGITAWAGQVLVRGAGDSWWRLIILMMFFSGVLSALISVNGAIAALLPVVVVLAVRLKRPPSQLLMPLVFGGHSGSMLALTGTPVNVLVLEASEDAGRGGFGYFEYRARRRAARPRRHGDRGLPRPAGCCPSARAARCRPTSAAMRARWSSSSASTTGCTSSACARARRWSAKPRATLDLAAHGVTLVTVRSAGKDGEPRLGAIAADDLLLVRGGGEEIAAADARASTSRSATRPTQARSTRSSSPAARGSPRCWCRRARR